MINLIIPPVSDCFMPTLGVAQIAGYLKGNGCGCKVIDANAELLHMLLNQQKELEERECTYKNTVECLSRYSAAHENLEISIDNFQTEFRWQELDQLQEYIMNEKEFSEDLKKLPFIYDRSVGADEEEWYGFSISYECQVIPAILLAQIIKEKRREAKIGLGGSLLYNYENDFYKMVYMTDWIDMLIIGAGEEAWEYIGKGKIDKLNTLSDIEIRRIYGKYIVDTRKRKEKPVVYEPDFSDINFDYYPSAEKAFPYMIKDRCYYGKCYFCNGDKVEEQGISKDIRVAYEKMHKIAKNIGIYNIYIVDAALSPKDLKAIADLPDMGLRWIANGRFEKELTDERLVKAIAQKGCEMLRFGLESASQKMLNYMNKGTKVCVAEEVLNLTARYGIRNHVYLMFGYPGETKEDREMTIEFMRRNRNVIFSYSVSLFQPIPGTVVYKDLLMHVEEAEKAYEQMIQLVYKDEFYYAEIYEDISNLNDLMYGYTKTNIEFYSANIFNQKSDVDGMTEKNFLTRTVSTKDKVLKEISIQFMPENKL